QHVDSHRMCALDIRQHAIADCKRVPDPDLTTQYLTGCRQCSIIDREMRLARDRRPPAKLPIFAGKSASAIEKCITAFDNDIRIGADEWQVSCPQTLQQFGIIIECLGIVIEEPGANNT